MNYTRGRKVIANDHYSPSALIIVVGEETVGSKGVFKDSLFVVPSLIRQMTLLLITISSHLSRNK